MPFLRFSRDKRGYEHTYLLHASAKKGGSARLLYWYRTPPGVKVGRVAFDEQVRQALEAQYPAIQFDWQKLMDTPPPPPDVEHWRERRRQEKAARQARQVAEREDTAELDVPEGETPDREARGPDQFDEADGPGGPEASSLAPGPDETDRPMRGYGRAVGAEGLRPDGPDSQGDEVTRPAAAEEGAAASAGAASSPDVPADGTARPRKRRRRGGRRRRKPGQATPGLAAGAAEDGGADSGAEDGDADAAGGPEEETSGPDPSSEADE